MELLDLVILKGNFENLSSKEKEEIKNNAQAIWDEMRRYEMFKKVAAKIILKGNIYKTMDKGTQGLSMKAKGAVSFHGGKAIGGSRKEGKIAKVYGIGENEKILLSIDQSLFKSLKESMVVTDKFIYGRTEEKKITKIPIEKVNKIYSNKYTVQINDQLIVNLKEINKEIRIYLELVFVMFKYGILDLNIETELVADYSRRFTGDLALKVDRMKKNSMDRGSIN